MKNRRVIKFNEVDAGASDPTVPAGKYRMRVKAFEKSKAKTGTEQIRCDYEILDNPEWESTEKKEYFPLEEKALWKVAQFIKAAYPDREELRTKEVDVDTIMFDDLLEGCIGESLFIYLGVEVYEGMERNYSRRYQRVESEGVNSPLHKAA